MTTLLVLVPALAHTKANHPENHNRLATMMPSLEMTGVLADLSIITPKAATLGQLKRAHAVDLIEYIRGVSAQGGGLLDRGDTYATPESYELARLAAGACCEAVDQIMMGMAQNGMALVRPPGHHAEFRRVSGFCLFNNVAVAARQARVVHGAERVLIIDFDVHHGNGTQDIFYDDQSVLFTSVHLFAPFFYPGVGALEETGRQQGEGYTLNVPLPAYVGDQGYRLIFEKVIKPKAAAFDPDLILVSVGFDAHWQDPLASAGLSLTGYAYIARTLVEMAAELCHGRILFVLEGGYKLDVLTYGILNVLYALIGRDDIIDPIGPMLENEHDIAGLIQHLQQRHLLI